MNATSSSPETSAPPFVTDAAPGAEPSVTPEQQVADLQARLTEATDSFLRAKAEAENTRRRADEEMAKARRFAVESFAESLEAAILIQNATPEQLLEGVHATLRQMTHALERNKVMSIAPPAGTKFDPHQHQAISVVPAEQEAGTVVAVLQKGYLIAERVLRPALVTVSAPK